MNERIVAAVLATVCLCSGAPVALAADVQATLDWVRRVELSTPVSGRIHEVRVDVGSRAAEGEVLLRLDERGFEASVRKARADLVAAREALAEAERELQRAEELHARTVLSLHDLQLAKLEYTRARSAAERAQAQLAQAELDLEYSVIRAPFPALVVQRRAQPGETVVTRLQSTPLLVVAEQGRLLARAAVDVEALRRMQVGESVPVRIGGRTYEGRITRLGLEPVSGPGEGSRYAVDVVFEVDPAAELRAGQGATVELP